MAALQTFRGGLLDDWKPSADCQNVLDALKIGAGDITAAARAATVSVVSPVWNCRAFEPGETSITEGRRITLNAGSWSEPTFRRIEYDPFGLVTGPSSRAMATMMHELIHVVHETTFLGDEWSLLLGTVGGDRVIATLLHSSNLMSEAEATLVFAGTTRAITTVLEQACFK